MPTGVRGFAGSGAAPPLSRPAPSQDSCTGDGGATPPGQTLAGGGGRSRMAYLLFVSLVGLQRSGRNLGRSGALYMEPFRDD